MNRAEGEAFIEKIEALVAPTPDGKGELDVSQLRNLVREFPELTIAAAKSYAATVADRRNHRQLALALALAYEMEFEDDSLSRSVERDLKTAGLDTGLTFKDPPTPPTPATPATPEIALFKVDAHSLQKAEVYSVTRLLAVDAEASSEFRPSTLRGRIVLGLPLDNDPRPVWQIPEARAFMARLFEAVPYLPYYLHPDPRFGMALMLFGCLASEDAFDRDGQLDLAHPTVVEPVRQAVAAVVEAAERLQDSREAALAQALSILPKDYVTWLLSQYDIPA